MLTKKISRVQHPTVRIEKTRTKLISAFALVALLFAGTALAGLPTSLKGVPIPKPDNLHLYVVDEEAAIKLGKAFFWDMQIGSDGQACATCHHSAGADRRTINTVNPGQAGGDNTFDVVAGPNSAISITNFPFRKHVDPTLRGTGGVDPNDPAILSDVNDVVGSQGLPLHDFVDLRGEHGDEFGRGQKDAVFTSGRRTVNRVTGRNAPTVINAIFNYSSFHDGRANHFFNGANPFGIQDVSARVFFNQGGALTAMDLTDPPNRINNASLASQAVGPPGSDVEMSFTGRSFPKIGKKILALTPLGMQLVHPEDSVLGVIANSSLTPQAKGLATNYPQMIRDAFVSEFWNGNQIVRFPDGPPVFEPDPGRALTTDEFTQMEANFSLFFGLSVMLYEATLVSDDTPFDRFVEGDPTALTDRQVDGLGIFTGPGGCAECHIGAEFTGASISVLLDPEEPGLIEVMNMGDNQVANYDLGFYNIGIRPTSEDIGRGGTDAFGNPLSFSRQAVIKAGLVPGTITFRLDDVPAQGCVPDLFALPPAQPLICPADLTTISRVAVNGSFKTPTLRNVELTGPYFHNGGMATLKQVVEFYTRGGDFHELNIDNLDPGVVQLAFLATNPEMQDALVDFLTALTDERVRFERAPFDHPQLFIANGHTDKVEGFAKRHRGKPKAKNIREIPAVGQFGREAEGLGPLRPFLWDGSEDFHFNDFLN